MLMLEVLISQLARMKSAAPLRGAEEQAARAISAYAEPGC
jgi:hypothetical protein